MIFAGRQRDKAQALLSLHTSGEMLVLPNIWDPIGARILEDRGDPAIATASAAIAESLDFATGVRDYQATEGNRAVHVLRRIEGEQAHFLVVTFWDSLKAIKKFAGEDVEKARYYPEDQDYLLEFEAKVAHYDVIVSA